MSETTAKVCGICKKDVSGTKHIKDKRGRYYCAPCYEAALERQRGAQAAAPAPAAAPTPTEQASGDDYDLAPAPAAAAKPVTRAPAAAAVSADKPAAKPLPEFCPNCGAKIIGNRKICFKCNRDVTQMDKLIAMRAKAAEEEAKGPGKTEVFATWFGRVTRVAMWIVIVCVIAFVLYGIKLMFVSEGIWDAYPTTREAAVREFLQCISTGSEKSYDRAFRLISFREVADASQERPRYMRVFKQMHDDFAGKYGADWLTKMKLENVGVNERYTDDEVDFRLTLGKDTYTIATQVQIDMTMAAANMTLPRIKRPVFNEDGKLHFGILDVAEYKARDQRRMLEMVGPGQPETLEPMRIPLDGGPR